MLHSNIFAINIQHTTQLSLNSCYPSKTALASAHYHISSSTKGSFGIRDTFKIWMSFLSLPSVLLCHWLGGRKGIQPVKKLSGGERGADLHMAQLMPQPLTVSCFSKIQICFTFLVLAHPRSPRQSAIKRVLLSCLLECRSTDSNHHPFLLSQLSLLPYCDGEKPTDVWRLRMLMRLESLDLFCRSW